MPIVQTPFADDDTIDFDALAREVDWALSVGADGVGTGMVSEVLRLDERERHELTRRLVESVDGRGAVFASVGAESTRQAVAYARHAESVGCDAVMALPPVTAALATDELRDYFVAIAEAVTVPLVVQDASGYVGQGIPHSVCRELLDRFGPARVVFKPEASPQGPNVSALRDACSGKSRLFEGSGGMHLVDCYRRGIAGTMPGVDLLDGIVALWHALRRDDDATVYRLYLPVCALVALQLQAGLDGFLAVEKHLLVRRGLFASSRRRRPYRWSLDAETAAEVDRLFDLLMREIERTPLP
ncbi:MAG: dihydrodipicolinate synthase family protein [Pirellulales bacterium]